MLWTPFACFCQVRAEVHSVSLRSTKEQPRGRCVDDQSQLQQPHQRWRQLYGCWSAAVTSIQRSVVPCNTFHRRPLSQLRPITVSTSMLQLLCRAQKTSQWQGRLQHRCSRQLGSPAFIGWLVQLSTSLPLTLFHKGRETVLSATSLCLTAARGNSGV